MPSITIGENTADDFSGFEDNFIENGASQDKNYGNSAVLWNGYTGAVKARNLLRIDLTNISVGNYISSGSLYLYDENYAGRTQNNEINIYKISDTNGNWIEGTASGTIQNGSSCWNYKAYNTGTWVGSVGLSTAGIDYINTVLANYTFIDGMSGYKEIVVNSAGLLVLNDWIASSGENGFLVIGDEVLSGSYSRIVSSQGTDGRRPYLSVTYSAIFYENIYLKTDITNTVSLKSDIIDSVSLKTDITENIYFGTKLNG